ncbi:uncharacterized protein A1O9_07244 [Exophiala aquamarina CBS 119918]|uniref:NmrA-like domain-containing protein n=1 Tax=Exophiala aquamarina CBS 119918 TaxID=1182545 RepID=A0A072PAB0_9EURO|nr:uncharacterized protein A1O9_07244 [Exophiala aquamarina CBS 119918]KEF57054.1 hypothetical protein A1O9_07244 [Exophiala aquamarina CBS 119918]
MASSQAGLKTIVFIGGTGAQGRAVLQYLSALNEYRILVLTRFLTGQPAKELSKLSNVELVETQAPSGYDLDAFLTAAKQSDYAFINTDGFAVGEIAETYWGIRLFEVARQAGVKHFVYSGLDSLAREPLYEADKHYVGHYMGKARVQEFLRAQPTSPMKWTIITSGPYIEMLHEFLQPSPPTEANPRLEFSLPLGSGSVPFIHLDDFGRYLAWTLSHPNESTGLTLGIAIAHISGPELAAAYTSATGRPAAYTDEPIAEWLASHFSELPSGADTKVGAQNTTDQNTLTLTFGENFTNWWNLYRASARNEGLIKRDYALLDSILPDRVRSAEEWFRKVEYDGARKQLFWNAKARGGNED